MPFFVLKYPLLATAELTLGDTAPGPAVTVCAARHLSRPRAVGQHPFLHHRIVNPEALQAG